MSARRPGTRIVADAVVCTLDLPTAYEQLLGDLRPPRAAAARPATRPRRWSGTSAYADCRPPSVAHHNIHFGTEWSAAFDACSSADS